MDLSSHELMSFSTLLPRLVCSAFVVTLMLVALTASSITLAAASNPIGKPLSIQDNASEEESGEMLVFVGTYAAKEEDSIHLFRLATRSGKLTKQAAYAGVANPSFLAIHPNGRNLYAVGEIGDFEGVPSGAVSAFEIGAESGALRLLNQQKSGGSGPCHLIVDALGQTVLVANYGSGSVATIHINADGSLGPVVSQIQHTGSGANPRRQEGPHAHSINLDKAQRFAFVADLGLDKVMIYPFDATTGKLTPGNSAIDLTPGDGPRHFAFHPDGSRAYVINELHSTITALSYSPADGKLEATGTVSTLPEGHTESNSTAEVQVHPSGRFVYGSNRGHDSIAVFKIIDTAPGLELVEHESTRGKTPRNFGIDPTGQFLIAANQNSGTIEVFQINPDTGALTFSGHSAKVNKPVCVKFLKITHP